MQCNYARHQCICSSIIFSSALIILIEDLHFYSVRAAIKIVSKRDFFVVRCLRGEYHPFLLLILKYKLSSCPWNSALRFCFGSFIILFFAVLNRLKQHQPLSLITVIISSSCLPADFLRNIDSFPF